MAILDEPTGWTAAQAAHWQNLDAVAAWNLLLSSLKGILRAARLYTGGGYSLGAAAETAGVHKLALMAALRLRIDSGPLSKADRLAIARAYAQAQRELAGGIPPEAKTGLVTEDELRSVMALVREALTPTVHRPTRVEFLDAVHRRVTA